MDTLVYGTIFASAFTLTFHIIKRAFKKRPIQKTNQELRESPEYSKWRLAVLQRDGWRCVWCHAIDNLEVDHIYPFAYFPELRFDVRNGRCLCSSCHKQTITYGSNAKKFYERFKQ